MPKINVGNVSLHYELSGREGAPCVVLSHSLGADMSTWQPQMPALEQHLSVLRYDMRGHGQSSGPDGPSSIADLAGDVLKLVDALGLGKVMFCGMSIGGAIGQWLGVHAPERIQRLLICD